MRAISAAVKDIVWTRGRVWQSGWLASCSASGVNFVCLVIQRTPCMDIIAEVKSGKTVAHGYRIGKYMNSLGRFGDIFLKKCIYAIKGKFAVTGLI